MTDQNPEKIYDIAIVGAGAAGMTAALYALRAKKSVIIFEEKTFGGQIITTHKIDNYPANPGITGIEFAKTLKSQVDSLGGEFYFSSVEKIEKDTSKTSDFPLFSLKISENDLFLAKTVIIANGSLERRLGLENEEKLIGRGISYCATCDGGFFKDKTVAVYGGGNTALYSALYLSGLAKTVYLIIRRDKFRAEPHLVKKAESEENIKIIKNTLITALNGEKSLNSVEISPNPAQMPSKTSNSADSSPVLEKACHDGSKEKNAPEAKILPLDGLFVSIGRIPDNSRFKNLVKLDSQGYILSDETCKTSAEGIFCAGDTREKKLHQLVTAASDGAIAATSAIEYLSV